VLDSMILVDDVLIWLMLIEGVLMMWLMIEDCW